ncbi:GNAT family N-acetyltransferase [Ideonella sp.]|uniref:GNAT family N-acetyltransferase n=1 Tax=Ideonella sp. TaxID=1929293 RepID=UPI002B487BB3|nr:GNAT family N-acetyltransferase [Ideonella sp.]HJV67665.1 GNAT family N-acetyltransferase [Ideonella sp.]
MDRSRAETLRPARVQDARALAEMSRDLIEGGLSWRYTPPRMAALIRERDTMALVASDGPRLHGFAVMQFGDTEAHLTLLCVQPAQRHRGIGRRLIEWLVASARVAGITAIRLELRADNASALAFYQRLGFVETQWLPGYYAGRIAARGMVLKLVDTAG